MYISAHHIKYNMQSLGTMLWTCFIHGQQKGMVFELEPTSSTCQPCIVLYIFPSNKSSFSTCMLDWKAITYRVV